MLGKPTLLSALMVRTLAALTLVPSDADICDITACDALRRMREEIAGGSLLDPGKPPVYEESQEDRINKIERRLRSVEQPCEYRAFLKFSLIEKSLTKTVALLILKCLEFPSPAVPVWRKNVEEDRWYRCCEGPCRCRPETFALSCWRQELDELPSNQYVPNDIRVIDLGINQITSLNRDAFKGLHRLVELDMFDNRIDFLPSVIFDNLDSLAHLRLHRNRLEDLHGKLFHKLANLETLDLSTNSIRRLAATLFRGTPRLVVLHLASNALEDLPESVFRGLVRLEELDLSSNVFLEFPIGIFKGLTNLKRLKLHDNRLKQLPPGVFSDLHFLDLLSLRRNRLTFIRPGLFDNQRYLTHLELTGNWISTVLYGNHMTPFKDN
ncbi:hypothetical protein J6590_039567 [Homalodisca vitripennis]|nr:hypothetical protein J6590_039567 [Homalodisca vitripennis]